MSTVSSGSHGTRVCSRERIVAVLRRVVKKRDLGASVASKLDEKDVGDAVVATDCCC